MPKRSNKRPPERRRKGALAVVPDRAVVAPQDTGIEVTQAQQGALVVLRVATRDTSIEVTQTSQGALTVVVSDRALVAAPQPLQDTSIEDAKATKATTQKRVWAMLLVVFKACVALVGELLR
jgi:hypothetical protein